MTLFLIIFMVFAVSCFMTDNAKKAKIQDYYKRERSDAPTQYDIACETVKNLGKQYREIASTLSLKDYLGNKTMDEIIVSTQCIDDYNAELAWLKVTAISCGVYKDDYNYIKYIYKNNIWDIIPDSIDKLDNKFITYWSNSYKNKLDSKKLLYYLKESVRIKNQILNNKEGNSYKAYRNIKIINILADKHDLPETNDCVTYGYFTHYDVNTIACNITLRKMNANKYGWAMIGEVCESPTIEQKNRQYKALTSAERKRKNADANLSRFSLYK